MPLTKDASANIAELTRVHGGEKDWPRERIIAAGLNAARENGGKVERHKKQRAQAEALREKP